MRKRAVTIAVFAVALYALSVVGRIDSSINDDLAREGGLPGLYHGTAVAADASGVE
jgi:hypothetical protein